MATRTMKNKRARTAACPLVTLSEKKRTGKPVRDESCEDVQKYVTSLVQKSQLLGQGAGHSIFLGTDNQAYSVRKMNFK